MVGSTTPSLIAAVLIVRWQDDYPDSWEAEEGVSPDIIALWEQQQQQEGQQQLEHSVESHNSLGNGTSSQSSPQLEASTV